MEEWQARMSHAEFVEWQAFDAVEPIGAARSDVQTAMLMMLLAHGFGGKKAKRVKLSDFLPDWWGLRRAPASLEAKFRALTLMLNRGNQSGDDTGDAGRSHRR